jgi:hypothetical protein
LAFFQKIRFNAMALAMLSGSALIKIPRVSEGFTISRSRLYFFANDIDFGKGVCIIIISSAFFYSAPIFCGDIFMPAIYRILEVMLPGNLWVFFSVS